MKKQGVVVAVEQGNAVICAERESSCSSCAGKAACGTLGSWQGEKGRDNITLPNTLHARPGDVVVVEVPDQLILAISLKLYGLPVLAFVIGGGLSFVMAEKAGLSGDLFSAIGGLLAAGFTWVWFMRHSAEMQQPKMTEILK